jgi:putative Mn2+ efflux pump MntP
MWQLLLGSILLSLVHAAIPNHWLPIVAIGKAEKWNQREILLVAGISGFFHTLSTVLVGITIGIIGIKLSQQYAFIAEKLAPIMLIGFGIIYILIDIFRHHRHNHGEASVQFKNRSKWAIIISLAIAMFLSPCLEIEAFYFQASVWGWTGILIVSLVYVLITVSGMILLTFLGTKGIQAINSHFLDHHERLLSGIILVIVGLVSMYIHF